MTMVSDLPQDLVEEILSRVPITCLRAVRSTCKRWNGLFKDPSFRKKHSGKAAKDSLVVMMNGYRVCLMSVNLNGIHNHKDLVAPSIKQIGEFNQGKICRVFHCNGLLLCLTNDCITSRLVVWNPYLGQTRWIEPRTAYDKSDMFSIGYDNNNNNHKILRLFYELDSYINYEIYDFKANSWRIIPTSYIIVSNRRGVSLKGNTYFLARKIFEVEEGVEDYCLLCFDFTKERFGPPLHLPFHYHPVDDDTVLSTVREEQLAVLFESMNTHKIHIWITTKIDPNTVSWNKFLAVRTETIIDLYSFFDTRSFFVDEEKKVAVICDIQKLKPNRIDMYQKACIVGEKGYIEEVNLGELRYCCPLVCSVRFQLPSLV
ncbi:putative F-box protein [Cardamine amara subsp. amara]|uniref:F-box protein n=1 Tax=Cardamine amara subsp. amara TaxID=228776 RepID=A0ABD1BE01_CARAN